MAPEGGAEGGEGGPREEGGEGAGDGGVGGEARRRREAEGGPVMGLRTEHVGKGAGGGEDDSVVAVETEELGVGKAAGAEGIEVVVDGVAEVVGTVVAEVTEAEGS